MHLRTMVPSPTSSPSGASSPTRTFSSSIQVTHKSHRSLGSALLHASARTFISRMLKLNDAEPTPAGSLQLTPQDDVHKHCNVRHIQAVDINIYEINPRSRSTKWLFSSSEYSGWKPGEQQARIAALMGPRNDSLCLDPCPSYGDEAVVTRDWAQHYGEKRPRPRFIYYFAGGGFQTPPRDEHWKLCSHLAHELTEKGIPTTVYLVSYPLAPNSPASASIPMLVKLYYALFPDMKDEGPLTQTTTNGSYLSIRDTQYPEIVFAGDSAGGNIALALTLHVLNTDPTAPAPDSLMLISPTVDMRMTNPEIAKTAKKDPMLSPATSEKAHKAWCGSDMEETDPRVSPTLADLTMLARNDVVVNGVLGTHDILTPDALAFVEKLRAKGIRGKWLVWEKQIHCFPLTFSHGVSEGREAVEWMKDVFNDKKYSSNRHVV